MLKLKKKLKLEKDFIFGNENEENLLVFIPGMTLKPEDYKSLFSRLKSDKNFLKYYAIGFGFNNYWYSNTDPNQIAKDISDAIEGISSKYKKIILVGHSAGGLLVRKCLITAVQHTYTWSKKVDRLVLLSSTNRGFVIRDFLENALLFGSQAIGIGKLYQHFQRGSDWVNQLRIDWSTNFKEYEVNVPLVVQIRGEEDEFVESDDSADLLYFENAYEVTLKNVDHSAFCKTELSDENIAIIQNCFFRVNFKKRKSKKNLPPMLVFLVHGIRDYAEWQEALAQEIVDINPNALVIPVQYGYFNAFQFLSPLQRSRPSRIFADKYIQAKLKYPQSEVAIAAHSNGTYAVAKAFDNHNFIKADRLYLAGSVLPRGFDWAEILDQDRLGVFRNDIANSDWPVGFLCGAIKWMDWRIGDAGFRGFRKIEPNNKYLKGPHGAALSPPYRSEVAQFLVSGEPQKLTLGKVDKNWLMVLVNILALPIFLGVIAGIVYLYKLIAIYFSASSAVTASAMLTILIITILSSL